MERRQHLQPQQPRYWHSWYGQSLVEQRYIERNVYTWKKTYKKRCIHEKRPMGRKLHLQPQQPWYWHCWHGHTSNVKRHVYIHINLVLSKSQSPLERCYIITNVYTWKMTYKKRRMYEKRPTERTLHERPQQTQYWHSTGQGMCQKRHIRIYEKSPIQKYLHVQSRCWLSQLQPTPRWAAPHASQDQS